MKKILIRALLMTILAGQAQASKNQFNILCELTPDITVRIFTPKNEYHEKSYTISGLYFQKVEAGNPAYCQLESGPQDLFFILNCEDPNSSVFDYKLKFIKDYKTAEVFTVIRLNSNATEDEYKLCQSLN